MGAGVAVATGVGVGVGVASTGFDARYVRTLPDPSPAAQNEAVGQETKVKPSPVL